MVWMGCCRAQLGRGKALLLVLPMLLANLPACAQAAQVSPSTQIGRLIRQNHLDEAEKELWDTLSGHPDQAWALRLLGTIRMRQNRPAEAEALYQRALTLNPHDLEACRGMAEAFTAQSQRDKAIAGYAQCVSFAPADVNSNAALT